MRTILITGAAGFIGANLVRMLLQRDEPVKLVALDKLTYAGNLANLEEFLNDSRLLFVHGDICDAGLVEKLFSRHSIAEVVNLAAESHVDRSILQSAPFVQTNIVGTQVLLDVARAANVRRFLQVSTDEVYGSLPENDPTAKFTELTPLSPNSPYSASKAAADCLVRAYHQTYGMPTLITRSSNNYGPYQFPEKIVPLFVTRLMDNKPVPLYGDGLNVRDWIYVEDHCKALWAVLDRGRPGEVYNIGGDCELTNRALTEAILKEMGKSWESSIEYVTDRPGHDRRYAIDFGKIRCELGWSPLRKIQEGLTATINWYRDHESWWRAIEGEKFQLRR